MFKRLKTILKHAETALIMKPDSTAPRFDVFFDKIIDADLYLMDKTTGRSRMIGYITDKFEGTPYAFVTGKYVYPLADKDAVEDTIKNLLAGARMILFSKKFGYIYGVYGGEEQ